MQPKGVLDRNSSVSISKDSLENTNPQHSQIFHEFAFNKKMFVQADLFQSEQFKRITCFVQKGRKSVVAPLLSLKILLEMR